MDKSFCVLRQWRHLCVRMGPGFFLCLSLIANKIFGKLQRQRVDSAVVQATTSALRRVLMEGTYAYLSSIFLSQVSSETDILLHQLNPHDILLNTWMNFLSIEFHSDSYFSFCSQNHWSVLLPWLKDQREYLPVRMASWLALIKYTCEEEKKKIIMRISNRNPVWQCDYLILITKHKHAITFCSPSAPALFRCTDGEFRPHRTCGSDWIWICWTMILD